MTLSAKKIQALLFIAGEAVALKDLTKLTNEPLENIQSYLEEVQTNLAEQGVVLLITKTDAHLVTSPDVADFLAEFLKDEATKPLSKAALETLALIAYKGPISRYDIHAIRGVDSRKTINHLLFKGLIKKVIEPNTTTAAFVISELFLQHMGIAKKEDLPDYKELSTNDTIAERIKNLTPKT